MERQRTQSVRLKLPSEGWTKGLAVAGLLSSALSPMPAWALWENLTNVSGSATITNLTPTSQRVNVFTGQYVGNLGSANIAANESVRIQQPNAASMALFRVAGQEATAIYGSLSANGQIFLVNPSGILFSSSARVDVGALTASTLNISTQDFLSGTYRFTQDPTRPNAAVVNQGLITAGPGGYVALLGAAVRNEGIIQANLGSIALAAGKTATLDMRGDGLIAFVLTDAVSGAVTGPDGKSLAAYVSNTGTLQADGGLVTLTANAAADVIKSVVNQEGIIRAQGMEERNGTIVLSGGSDGIVTVSGTVDASGTGVGQTGGTVHVLGQSVGLFGANINASGDAGGGTVLVGGDLHGQGTVQNASFTYVSSDSTISADAITRGNGGKVVIWANDGTRYHGSISARGGAESGDGGFVEVSGKQNLDFDGRVDTSAPNGRAGSLLLDPDDLCISVATPTACGGGAAINDSTNPFQAIDGVNNYFVSQSTLQGLGANTNVVLQANNDIIFETSLAMAQTNAGSFSATASNAITMAGFGLTTNNGDVTLTAGAGGITNMGNISAGNGTLTLNASGAMTQQAGTAISGGTDLVKQGSGTLTLSQANTYTGGTTVSAGVIDVQNNTALSTGATTVASGAAVQVDGSGLTIATPLTSLIGTGIGGAGALRNLANNNTWSGAITLGAGGARINSDGGTLTLSGAIGGNNQDLTVGGAGNTTISNVIGTNNGTLTKDGAGTLTLSNANTYRGLTTINAGTVIAASNNALGTNTNGTTVASGATLGFSGGITYSTTEAVTINGTGDVGNSRAGAIDNIAGVNSFAGAITLGSASTIGASAGTLTLSGAVGGATRPLTVGGAGNTTISGVIGTTTGTLTKNGAGTLTLSGANTYTGLTTVNVGVIDVQNNTALGTVAGATTVASGAAVQIDGTGLSIAEPITSLIGTGIAGAGALRNLANNNTWAGAITLGAGGARINSDGGILTLSGAGNITGATQPLTVGGAGDTTISKIIATTTGTLTKDGAGTLTLSGLNTFTGLTTVSAGTLAYGVSNALASGPVTVSGGTWALGTFSDTVGAVTLTSGSITGSTGVLTGTSYAVQSGAISAILAGAGVTLTKTTAGTVTLSGTNTYTGATTVTAGTLTEGANNVLADASSLVVNGGTFDINTRTDTVAGVQLTSGSITGTTGVLTSTSAYDMQAGTVSAILGGAVGLNKTTAGTVTLSGANTYTGTTTVSAGVLDLQSNTALGTVAGGTTVASGAALQIDGSGLVIAEPITSLIGTGIAGGGALRNLANNNTWTGALTLGAGGARINSDAGTLTIATGGITGATQPLTVGGAGNTTISAVIGTTTGTLTKDGAGTLTLSGANTYTGTTTINAGTLSVSGGSALADTGAVSINGTATFNLASSETIGNLTGVAGTFVTLNANTLTTGDASNTTFAGVMSGTGALTKQGSGIFTLSGANTYTGTTTINAGTVSVTNADGLGSTAGGTVVASGATLDINNVAVGAEAVTLNGTGVGGFGALTGTGAAPSLAGTVTLGSDSSIGGIGALTFGGSVVGGVNALTLVGSGTDQFNGTVAVDTLNLNKAAGGNVTFANNLTVSTTMTTLANNFNIILNGASNSIAGATAFTNTGTVTLVSGTNTSTFTGGVDTTGGPSITNVGGTLNTTGTTLRLGTTTLTTDTTLNAGAGAITLASTVDGAFSLTANSTGVTTFSAAVGGTTPLTSLITNAGGTTVISGGLVSTTGAQTYNDPLTLTVATTLTSTGGDLTANAAVDATAGTLTLATGVANNISFNNAGNDFATVKVTSGNNVTLSDTNALDLGASTVSGALTVTANGAITDSGNLVVAGTTTLAAGAGNNITLDSAGNNFSTVAITSGNNVTLVDTNAIDLGVSTVSGALTVTAGGAITQTGALTVVGGASFDTSANAAIGTVAITAQNPAGALTVNASQIAGDFLLDIGARDVTFNPNVDVGQNMTLTTTGTITGGANIRSAGTTNTLNDATTITATGAAVNFDLTQALLNAATGPGVTVNLFSTGYTAATPQGASAVTLNLANSIGGPLTITTTNPGIAAGGITDYNVIQSGALNFGGKNITVAARAGVNFGGLNTLNGNNGSLVTLTQANTNLGSIAFSNTYNSAITTAAANAVALMASTVNGSLMVTSGGAITQTGALIVAGTSSFAAGANTITLMDAANDFQGAVALSGGTTQIADTNALTLGTLATGNLTAISTGALNLGTGTVTGTLAATSNGGAITETAGGLTVTGTSNINAGAGAITLTDVANDFQGAVSLTGGTTQITDANALTFGTLATGNLTAISTGALNLGTGTVTGTLAATSNGGAITQSGALTVTGAAIVNAGAGVITLTTGTNDFQGAVSLTGGTTQITDTNALTLGTLATGDLTANATGALNLGQGTVTGALTATSGGGAITQAGALMVTGTSTVNAGANTITLTNPGNDFQGAVSATNTGANAIQLRDANALVLGTINTADNLAVTAGGAITQTGVLTVTGTTSLQVTAAASDILLASQANNLGGAVSLAGTVTNIRDLALRNVNAGATVPSLAGTTLRDLTLIFDNAAVAVPGAILTGNLNVTAGGAITDSGNLVVAGTTTLAAGAANNITLDNANNFSTVAITSGNNVTLVDANALDLGASTVSGTLNVTAGGAITQTGALTVTGATSLQVTAAASDILLASQANNLGGPVSLAGTVTNIRDLALRNVNAGATVPNLAPLTNLRNLTLIFDNAAVTLNGVTWSGILNATATGITLHASAIAAGDLGNLNAGAGAITLDIGNNNLNLSTMATSLTGGTLNVCAGPNICTGTVTTGAGFTFAGNVNLGSGATPIAGNITVAGPLQATGGALTIDATGTITGAGGITAASASLTGKSIGAFGAPLTLSSSMTLSGTVTGTTATPPMTNPVDVFNVKTSGPFAITIGAITATAQPAVTPPGSLHDVTIDTSGGLIGPGGNIQAAGTVALMGTPVATAGLPLTSTNPVTCNGHTCNSIFNEFVNTLGTIFILQQAQLISGVLSGIQSALAVNQCGPSGLLCEGVLPENIFKSLGSRVLEVVGGGEDSSEGGELPGVTVIGSEEVPPTDDELRKKKRFQGTPQ